jgi:hypothetical protein
MKTNKLNAVNLILSDSRGIYIPRDFLLTNEVLDEPHCKAWGLTDENKGTWVVCLYPDSKWYWEAWEWILNNAKYMDIIANFIDGLE